MGLKTVKNRPFVKGFKATLHPTKEQQDYLAKIFGHNRFVWNTLLYRLKEEYKHYIAHKDIPDIAGLVQPSVTGFDIVKRLPALKMEFPWLYEVPSDTMQQTALHLGSAFSRFFKNRKGYPKFKKAAFGSSATLTSNTFKLNGNTLYLSNPSEQSRLEIPVWFSRPLPSCPSSAVITRSATGKYEISFVCEYFPKKTSGNREIGIDLGLKDYIVLSDGERIANPRHYKSREASLAKKQKKLSRAKKGSNRYNILRHQVAQIHERIKNSRRDFLHKTSRRLVNESQVIGIESLRPSNMVKNHRLAKAITDASWTAIKTMIIYKARESQHCRVVLMDPFYASTHICNDTGFKSTSILSLKDRSWLCPHCGKEHDRDINAAKNMLSIARYEVMAGHVLPGQTYQSTKIRNYSDPVV